MTVEEELVEAAKLAVLAFEFRSGHLTGHDVLALSRLRDALARKALSPTPDASTEGKEGGQTTSSTQCGVASQAKLTDQGGAS